MMITRELQKILKSFKQLYPIIGITGPRQSGKTTLAEHTFPDLPYVSLENLDTRSRAIADPRGFLNAYQNGAIFDEIQKTPDLLSYLQEIVDKKKEPGRYIITGSQNFVLSHQISQTLPGRIGMTTLLPLSISELNTLPSHQSVIERIFYGGYPAIYQRHIQPTQFYPSYIQTYIERDVREFKNIENLHTFQNFLKLCAGRIGQTINLTSLAQDCGISHTTARAWLSVLEASYIIFFVPPFYKNFSKRVIKMPKLYFYDTGLACSLLTLEHQEQIDTHYLKGALYENLVVLELLKMRLNQALPTNLYFWRDHTGHEIDLIAEWGGTIKAIEIKYTETFSLNHLSGLSYFRQLEPETESYLVYNGKEKGMTNQSMLVPFSDLSIIQR